MVQAKVQLLALTMMPKVGPVVARQLIAGCGSVEAVFCEKPRNLLRIPGIGPAVVNELKPEAYLRTAEKELRWAEKKGISVLTWEEPEFPSRLQHVESSPLVLFYKGNADLNKPRIVSIVGTRSPSAYGKAMCERIVEELLPYQPLLVSGLAYGIDAAAHKKCLDTGIATIGVLGHGLDRLYPASHAGLAAAMQENGGVLTEFISGTLPDKENFPMRNRIIAAMSDAVVVIESGKKGGSMITAEFANDFNKDVFAIPGQVDLPHSEGTNHLIKFNKAHLIEHASDIAGIMRWEQRSTSKVLQKQLFLELSPLEQRTIDVVKQQNDIHIDVLTFQCALSPGEMAAVLLNLECKGLIKALPGRKYAAVM
jgi:DNA processing protein